MLSVFSCVYVKTVALCSVMSSVSHGSWHNGNLNHLRCNYKLITDYPLCAFSSSSQPSLPFHNPPSILPYSYSNSSNYVPALHVSKACFYFCVFQRRILPCTLFCKCAMLTSGLHVAQGIFCCVHVLMEIMRLPTRA